jgi:hypothetical protein
MDSRIKIGIFKWQSEPAPFVVRKRPPHRFMSPSAIGIFGTVLLHTLAFHALSLGQGRDPKHPELQQTALASQKAKSEATESLVLISMPTNGISVTSASNNHFDLLNFKQMQFIAVTNLGPPDFSGLNLLPLDDVQTPATTNEGDGTEQARFVGIYTGQIRARVERVWRRPRSPIGSLDVVGSAANSDSFECQVQIVQDSHGNVQEVLLPQCNGTPAWQRSLVIAIQQSSPLPAPPSESVFSRSIVLNFVAFPFVPGSPVEEYEQLPRNLARASE